MLTTPDATSPSECPESFHSMLAIIAIADLYVGGSAAGLLAQTAYLAILDQRAPAAACFGI
jgi:hypothetical protein